MDIARWFSELLHQPLRMLLVSVGVCTALLLYDGSLEVVEPSAQLQRDEPPYFRRYGDEALAFSVEEVTKMSFVERQATFARG